MRALKREKTCVKRGDTLVEVMVAMAILAVVTIVTVTMMNQGLNVSERSLELTTARNELNAQAEALRFIHSSYVSELNLPKCNSAGNDVRCQAFADIWEKIVEQAIPANQERKINLPTTNCERDIYDDGKRALIDDHAFIINTRLLQASNTRGSSGVNLSSIVTASGSGSNLSVFQMPDLSARLLYTGSTGVEDTALHELTEYTNLIAAQGIWVVGIKSQELGANGSDPMYYDFHIETCWNNAGSNTPSSLDAVIRLYNPAAR